MTQDQVSLYNYIYKEDEFNKKEKEVFNVLLSLGGKATSREIMIILGTENPNNVRPRLTDLFNKDPPAILKCGITHYTDQNGRTIAENVWRINNGT